jgi:sialate O-acetylesterase
MTIQHLLIIALFFSGPVLSRGEIKLPRLISDGMILQRESQVRVWGWANPGESIRISFLGKKLNTIANDKGEWHFTLDPMVAGGPHMMIIDGEKRVEIKDILIGDVWLCSGQSNMELSMERVKEKYPAVISSSANPKIRHFLVPDKYNFNLRERDLTAGQWVSATPKDVLNFSAVGYFFARDLYEKYRVPIGLINAALGGSPAEAWMSEEALEKFPDLLAEGRRFKDDKLIKEIESADQLRSNAWYKELNLLDNGLSKWSSPALEDSSWEEMKIPGYWADQKPGQVNGAIWFRKKIHIPASMTNKTASLWLGRIVDSDSVFVNGRFVGSTGYQYPPRRYTLAADILKEGMNLITIRVINSSGRGGFVPEKPYFIAANTDTIRLDGKWKYKVGATMPLLQGQTFIRWKPFGLFNAMIAPLTTFAIKGAIWYQGESNTTRAKEYNELFPALIHDWRTQWNDNELPFLFVQLPNFMEEKQDPSESQWAELREAQLNTFKKTVATGMVVAIDAGEWNDIHPTDKQTIGKRLALVSQRVAYNEKAFLSSGPVLESFKIAGNKIELTFSNAGKGLVARNGDLKHFAITGADKKFVWAKAKIKGNKVIVWNDIVSEPRAVRYAWADNPAGANLYNSAGMPASPFRTDQD